MKSHPTLYTGTASSGWSDPGQRGTPLGIPTDVLTDPVFVGKFWARVEKLPTPRGQPYSSCWLWKGPFQTEWGAFMRFMSDEYVENKRGLKKKKVIRVRANRVAMLLTTLDFDVSQYLTPLCGNKRCVNPAHMKAISAPAKSPLKCKPRKAKKICRNGHAMTPENTRLRSAYNPKYGKTYTTRLCRTCIRNTRAAK